MDDMQQPLSCNVCHAKGEEACPCQERVYCSSECQTRDWYDGGHGDVCAYDGDEKMDNNEHSSGAQHPPPDTACESNMGEVHETLHHPKDSLTTSAQLGELRPSTSESTSAARVSGGEGKSLAAPQATCTQSEQNPCNRVCTPDQRGKQPSAVSTTISLPITPTDCTTQSLALNPSKAKAEPCSNAAAPLQSDASQSSLLTAAPPSDKEKAHAQIDNPPVHGTQQRTSLHDGTAHGESGSITGPNSAGGHEIDSAGATNALRDNSGHHNERRAAPPTAKKCDVCGDDGRCVCKCRKRRFCSRKCQLKDWRAGHRLTCANRNRNSKGPCSGCIKHAKKLAEKEQRNADNAKSPSPTGREDSVRDIAPNNERGDTSDSARSAMLSTFNQIYKSKQDEHKVSRESGTQGCESAQPLGGAKSELANVIRITRITSTADSAPLSSAPRADGPSTQRDTTHTQHTTHTAHAAHTAQTAHAANTVHTPNTQHTTSAARILGFSVNPKTLKLLNHTAHTNPLEIPTQMAATPQTASTTHIESTVPTVPTAPTAPLKSTVHTRPTIPTTSTAPLELPVHTRPTIPTTSTAPLELPVHTRPTIPTTSTAPLELTVHTRPTIPTTSTAPLELTVHTRPTIPTLSTAGQEKRRKSVDPNAAPRVPCLVKGCKSTFINERRLGHHMRRYHSDSANATLANAKVPVTATITRPQGHTITNPATTTNTVLESNTESATTIIPVTEIKKLYAAATNIKSTAATNTFPATAINTIPAISTKTLPANTGNTHPVTTIKTVSVTTTNNKPVTTINKHSAALTNIISTPATNTLSALETKTFPATAINAIPATAINTLPARTTNTPPVTATETVSVIATNTIPVTEINRLYAAATNIKSTATTNTFPATAINTIPAISTKTLPANTGNTHPVTTIKTVSVTTTNNKPVTTINKHSAASTNIISTPATNTVSALETKTFPATAINAIPATAINTLPARTTNTHPLTATETVSVIATNTIPVTAINKPYTAATDMIFTPAKNILPSAATPVTKPLPGDGVNTSVTKALSVVATRAAYKGEGIPEAYSNQSEITKDASVSFETMPKAVDLQPETPGCVACGCDATSIGAKVRLQCSNPVCKTVPTNVCCQNFSDGLARNLINNANPWYCYDCKVCTICGRIKKEEEMLLCDGCDQGTHAQCASPPRTDTLVPSDEPWYCPDCARKVKLADTHARQIKDNEHTLQSKHTNHAAGVIPPRQPAIPLNRKKPHHPNSNNINSNNNNNNGPTATAAAALPQTRASGPTVVSATLTRNSGTTISGGTISGSTEEPREPTVGTSAAAPIGSASTPAPVPPNHTPVSHTADRPVAVSKQGGKSFRCVSPDCSAEFRDPATYRQHMRESHAEEYKRRTPFPCHEIGCGNRFTDNAKYTQHVASHARLKLKKEMESARVRVGAEQGKGTGKRPADETPPTGTPQSHSQAADRNPQMSHENRTRPVQPLSPPATASLSTTAQQPAKAHLNPSGFKVLPNNIGKPTAAPQATHESSRRVTADPSGASMFRLISSASAHRTSETITPDLRKGPVTQPPPPPAGDGALNPSVGPLSARPQEGSIGLDPRVGPLSARSREGSIVLNPSVGPLSARSWEGSIALDPRIGPLSAKHTNTQKRPHHSAAHTAPNGHATTRVISPHASDRNGSSGSLSNPKQNGREHPQVLDRQSHNKQGTPRALHSTGTQQQPPPTAHADPPITVNGAPLPQTAHPMRHTALTHDGPTSHGSVSGANQPQRQSNRPAAPREDTAHTSANSHSTHTIATAHPTHTSVTSHARPSAKRARANEVIVILSDDDDVEMTRIIPSATAHRAPTAPTAPSRKRAYNGPTRVTRQHSDDDDDDICNTTMKTYYDKQPRRR